MTLRSIVLGGAGVAALALGAAAVGQAKGGPAVYWMSADTVSGFGAMAAGGKPSVGAIMGGMMGRGGASHARTLTLQLGSPQRAAGAPSAEHVPPGGLIAGPSLPLVTPQGARATGPAQPWSGQMEKPRGRMLIYWGCGERARAGQPLVVDFASMAAGKMPPALASAMLKPMVPPSAAAFATYGEWPNERTKSRVPANGSLVGEHVVRGNYSPEMRFTLGAGQDFLAPVGLTSNAASGSGSVPLVWRPVPGARAWFASTMGSSPNGDFVIWTSSETQAAAMAMDYVSESDILRLIQQRALMPASADRCTVPVEVARTAPQSMLMLSAFGGEANFAQPKPAAAPASWRPAWTAKLRTKSTHMGLLGMNMPGMDDDDGGDAAADPAKPKKKKSKLGRIRDVMGQ